MKILSIDPGGRNCGVVLVECDGNGYNPVVRTADLVSIAYRKDTMVTKVEQTRAVLGQYFVDVDTVVVENQNFGKRNSTIDNVIFQSVIMSLAMEKGAHVVVLDSRSKKNKFEKYGFVSHTEGKHTAKKQRRKTKRKIGKLYAQRLADFLCSHMRVYTEGDISGCEHRSDALCLAAVHLLSENKFPMLLKQEEICPRHTTCEREEDLLSPVSSVIIRSGQRRKAPTDALSP